MTALQLWNRFELPRREAHLCLRANRWGERRAITRFFGLVVGAVDLNWRTRTLCGP